MVDYSALLARVAEIGSLSQGCRELGIPKSTFLDAVDRDPELAVQYARAKERGIDAMMEELLDAKIEDAAISRLEWDRKRWHASKLFRKRYGDKQLIGSDPENPLPAPLDLSKLSSAALKEIVSLDPDK